MTSKRKKVNEVPIVKRNNDRLTTLKTQNFVGLEKNYDGPLVIHEEEELEPVGVTTKRMKTWKKIQKGLTQ